MSSLVVIFFFYSLQILGLSASGHDTDFRIVNGEVASLGQFPYTVGFRHQKGEVIGFCGGALTNNKLILTAAHCIADATNFTIYLGTPTLEQISPGGLVLSSTEYVVHPQYNPNTFANDIGFIILEIPVEFTDNIQAIELATSTLGSSQTVTILGWGTTNNDETTLSNTLQHVSLQTISNAQCLVIFNQQSIITGNVVCAVGTSTGGTCRGDAGGPLVQIVDDKSIHVGLSMFHSGRGCEYRDPSGFVRTFPYIDWIQNVTETYSSASMTTVFLPLIIFSVIHFA